MIYREQDIVHPRRTYPFPGDEVFFYVFPGRNAANGIGRFPFRIVVACPQAESEIKNPDTQQIEKQWQPHAKPYNSLMEFLSVIGVNYPWVSAADMVNPISEKEQAYRRYCTRREMRPVVVDVEAVENPHGISSSDTSRLAGFIALIDGHSPFFHRDKIIGTAPIDALRMFKPRMSELDLKRTFYSLKEKAFGETRIEDIPLDGMLHAIFDRLHSALRNYRNTDHPDVVSDYVFNLARVLANELAKARRICIRICPVCLKPLPAKLRPNQVYCQSSSCSNVARYLRATKKVTEDHARTLLGTVRPLKQKN